MDTDQTPPHSDVTITVVTGSERLTARQQIEQVVQRAKERGEPVRVRIPFWLYNAGSDNRGYTAVRETAWNLQLASAQTTPETIERLIETIGKCMVAIGQHGSSEVEEALRQLGDSQ